MTSVMAIVIFVNICCRNMNGLEWALCVCQCQMSIYSPNACFNASWQQLRLSYLSKFRRYLQSKCPRSLTHRTRRTHQWRWTTPHFQNRRLVPKLDKVVPPSDQVSPKSAWRNHLPLEETQWFRKARHSDHFSSRCLWHHLVTSSRDSEYSTTSVQRTLSCIWPSTTKQPGAHLPT